MLAPKVLIISRVLETRHNPSLEPLGRVPARSRGTCSEGTPPSLSLPKRPLASSGKKGVKSRARHKVQPSPFPPGPLPSHPPTPRLPPTSPTSMSHESVQSQRMRSLVLGSPRGHPPCTTAAPPPHCTTAASNPPPLPPRLPPPPAPRCFSLWPVPPRSPGTGPGEQRSRGGSGRPLAGREVGVAQGLLLLLSPWGAGGRHRSQGWGLFFSWLKDLEVAFVQFLGGGRTARQPLSSASSLRIAVLELRGGLEAPQSASERGVQLEA